MVGMVHSPKPHPYTRLQLPGLHPSFADCSAVGTVAIGYKVSVSLLEVKLGKVCLRKWWGNISKTVVAEGTVLLLPELLAGTAVAAGEPFGSLRTWSDLGGTNFAAGTANEYHLRGRWPYAIVPILRGRRKSSWPLQFLLNGSGGKLGNQTWFFAYLG